MFPATNISLHQTHTVSINRAQKEPTILDVILTRLNHTSHPNVSRDKMIIKVGSLTNETVKVQQSPPPHPTPTRLFRLVLKPFRLFLSPTLSLAWMVLRRYCRLAGCARFISPKLRSTLVSVYSPQLVHITNYSLDTLYVF